MIVTDKIQKYTTVIEPAQVKTKLDKERNLNE